MVERLTKVGKGSPERPDRPVIIAIKAVDSIAVERVSRPFFIFGSSGLCVPGL